MPNRADVKDVIFDFGKAREGKGRVRELEVLWQNTGNIGEPKKSYKSFPEIFI